ncbi:DNA-binding MarR family transcriptional regulator [Kaistia hirudinis]|uniref:DNA-binding MarR family transcriptional regulator n=1 Tax=Kaistia hirudinis TaxID=1293440 RepID=A0A840APB2_9HYPH|nr:DNA-binding MarR family transcriptional regulator [Kaistia hirudinis]
MSATEPSEAVVNAWVGLMRAQQVALQAIEADLKQAGLPPLGWYDALLELRRAEGGALRPLELQQRLLLAQHNVSRLIDRLEEAGHVHRSPCSSDGRGQMVSITESGRALLDRMWPIYRAAIAAHVGARLDNDADATTLARLLGQLAARG